MVESLMVQGVLHDHAQKQVFPQIYVWLSLVGLVVAGTEGNLGQINELIFSDISE